MNQREMEEQKERAFQCLQNAVAAFVAGAAITFFVMLALLR